MNAKQAKDFLVQQTVEQASIENVPLSDLEKRMMYFVENDPSSCENPLELNDEFESQYETAEYEAKMSRLLHHAYRRLKKTDPEKVRDWSDAIRTLSRGDRYIPVLWAATPASDHPIRDFFKPFGIGLLIAVGIFAAIVLNEIHSISLSGLRRYWPALALCALILLFAFRSPRELIRFLSVWFQPKPTDDSESK